MDITQFETLAAQGYNRIPIVGHVLADSETPLSVYLKLANTPFSYLLESVEGGEKWGRYSIIGLPCQTILRVNGGTITLTQKEGVQHITAADPLTWIEEFHQTYRTPTLPDLPRFYGGLVGYFGYDTVRYVEPRLGPSPNPETLDTPDILLMLSEELVVFDNLNHTLLFIILADPTQNNAYENAQKRIQTLIHQLNSSPLPVVNTELPSAEALPPLHFRSNTDPDRYQQAIASIKRYILEGDVMQVVYSHRMQLPFAEEPLNFYRALRYLNPSPYLYYFNLDGFYIAGSSPEVLVRVEDQHITLRPLAGTRARGQNELEDQQLEQELLADPKEIAEHLMLIDLGRNDVGRVSISGTVAIPKMMVIERYSHVMHISSTVTGELRPELKPMDALKAALPAGTLSGAPKVRAMEIIDELEVAKRGIYGGAVGYLAWNGNMDMAIALRTAIIKDQTLYTQAGGGIVADSVPTEEWEETQRKARAIFKAAALAQQFSNDIS